MRWYSSSMLVAGPVCEAVQVIAAAGFDGVEVWFDQALAHDEPAAAVAAVAQRAGVGLTVHASSYDVNLAAWNPGIRSACIRQTELSIRYAADIGAGVVVVHPGRRSTARQAPEACWIRTLQALEPLDALAEQLGVTVAIELMERRPTEIVMLPADGRRVLDHGFRAMGLTIDLAHAYTHGDPRAFLAELAPGEITHVHLSDSDPRTVHLPLGQGDAPLGPLVADLQAIAYDRVVTIEGYEPGRGDALVRDNARRIRELAGSSSPA